MLGREICKRNTTWVREKERFPTGNPVSSSLSNIQGDQGRKSSEELNNGEHQQDGELLL